MRIPIRKFADQENVSVRFLYNEIRAGRLVVDKVGSRTFVSDENAQRWRATAPKVTGRAGDIILKVAEQKLAELGAAVAAGQIDRDLVIDRLAKTAARVGLQRNPVEHRVA